VKTAGRRRQLLTIAAVRSFASVAVLAMAYFLLPFTRLAKGKLIAEFTAGILLVIVVLTAQTVGTLRSRYPLLRSVELWLLRFRCFSLCSPQHYLLNELNHGSYSEPMTRVGRALPHDVNLRNRGIR
jgi:hypothetical protein